MASVDDKVVSMSFESSKFESGVNKTINALNKLKEALHFPQAGKGIEDFNKAASKTNLSPIARAIDAIKGKLGALRLVGIGVLTNIANRAVAAGARLVKALTIDPIIQGYHEYETQLNAVQTILSNTRAAGTNLKDVNRALNELNKYADKTIYNFSEMTRNIGTFTAAGVDLKTSVASIKGIANLAAVSGSNAQQASTAMYQLSQAISAGTVKLQDWNSVVNAGMGGTLFQRALAQTATHMGTLKQGAVTLSGAMKNVTINGQSFRQSLASAGPGKKSWLTSGVLTTTLKQLSGDMTDAQLKAMGYNEAQIKAIQQQAKMAVNAATQVKTLSQLLDTTKEAVGSGWAQTWQIIFGDFGEAKTLFTGLSNAINGFVSASSNARNKVLADWKKLGGRTLLLDSLKQAFHDLVLVIKPIQAAFRDIFPAVTGKNLYDLTVRFKQFTEELKPSPQTIEGLRRTFRGLFAVLDIGKQILGGIFTVFKTLIATIAGGSGSFLAITGTVGDFLVKIDQALKKGDRLHNFFVGLGAILAVPLKALTALGDALRNLFSGFSAGGISGQIDGVTKSLTPFQRIVQAVGNAWAAFLQSFEKTGTVMQPIINAFVSFIQGLGPAINTAIANTNWQGILAVIRTGLLGGIYLLFRNFFGKGSLMDQVSKGFAGGIMGNISGSFSALEGSMKALQTNIKAKTLKEIAIAIALLTASVVALSFVDAKKLNASLAAMAIAFGQLIGALILLDKYTSGTTAFKLPFIAASMILLAGAIDLLTLSVLALSRLSWSELLKGLGGVAVLLGGIVAVSGPLSKASPRMIAAGVGITALAVGLNILALAVRQMGSMSLGMIAKGLGSVAIALGIVSVAMKTMPTNMLVTGAGLIAVGVGLNAIALAIKQIGGMNWKVIGKGLLGIGLALVIVAGAMKLMPNMIASAAGLLIVAVALQGISKAIVTMGGMSVAGIAKGLIALALALTILAAAMIVMQGAIGGAVALSVAAVGVTLMAGALATLGGLSWKQIVKGLVALAAVFVVIGAAAILLTEAIPSMLGFGAALILIGAGLALAGAGIALIGIGLSAVVTAVVTAIGVLVGSLEELQKAVINYAKLVALGILEVVRGIAKTAPQLVDALIHILNSLLDALPKLLPKLEQTLTVLIDMIVKLFADNQGKIIQAGFNLVMAILAGINQNIPAVVRMVTNIIITILNAIAKNLVRLQAAGINIVASLIRGIASNYLKIVNAAIDLVVYFIKGIANSYSRIITAGVNLVARFVSALASNIGRVISAGANLVTNFVIGIANAGARLIVAGTNAITKFIRAIAAGALKLVNEGAKAVIRFMNGVADALNKYEPQMVQAGIRIGIAIATGVAKGIAQSAPAAIHAAENMIKAIPNKALKLLHIKSPSKIFEDIGVAIVDGLARGMGNTTDVENAAANMSNTVIDTVKTTFQITSPSKVMQQLGQYVGQGFAQGVRGSADDIKQAFVEMNNKLTDAMSTARQTINTEQAKIREERAKGKKADKQAIAEAQKTVEENRLILSRTTAAHTALVKTLQDEKNQLTSLAKQYVVVSDKLKDANQALADAKQVRDDAFGRFSEQYGQLPEIVTTDAEGNAVDQLATYEGALQHQAEAVAAYQSTLDQLRKLGLDDKTYQKLVEEGTADQAFASQLLAGGRTAVQGLNALDSQLAKVSATLATQASRNLYQAGVDAAQGLVNGLESKQSAIAQSMEKLASLMVRTLKKKLKIKSPSEIFAEIGQQSSEGMAKGLTDSSKLVTDAVDTVSSDALDAMRKNMQGISDAVLNEIDPNPTITPVLDLTQVQAGVSAMNSMLATTPLTPTVSTGQASAISSAQATQADQVAVLGGTSVKFEQNNYSPEALTEIEIYRQTKNQLSQLRSALAIS